MQVKEQVTALATTAVDFTTSSTFNLNVIDFKFLVSDPYFIEGRAYLRGIRPPELFQGEAAHSRQVRRGGRRQRHD